MTKETYARWPTLCVQTAITSRYNDNLEKHGRFVRYVPFIHGFSQRRYHNDKEDGPHKIWFKNGQLRELRYFKNGVLEGERTLWHYNGVIREKSNTKNGVLDGEYQRWYRNGTLKEQGYMKRGLKNGVFKLWDSYGNLKYERV
eukprot:CAMPEP_0168533238 /NCGR_PEP_ID=MMETSP0405-20121227/16929_1 /TAXON_ID=498012 /ORGANISM="Trichosphaerium sp, Strain Am-I-7 wt" /LENGTH=142 /DNA_ID=CAMNT_0008559203 /DNA_START=79 /DNA_END=503 /DNA_ORIENTATION=+